MCGGRGTRLECDVEKPRYRIGGRPMIDRVHDALRASRVETVYAVPSPATPNTRKWFDGPVIEAPGDGYVSDLQYALERVEPPVLTVPADLPLLGGDAIDRVLESVEGGPVAVGVPVALKRALGASVGTTLAPPDDDLAAAGINVVGGAGPQTVRRSHDARLAVNVNTPSDARLAERLL